MLVLCSSLRAEVIYATNVGRAEINGNNNLGNTFINTTGSAKVIQTISLYLANQGNQASGTMRLGIYATEQTSDSIPMYNKTGSALATASINVSSLPNSPNDGATIFNFSSFGLSIANNTRYAFYTDNSDIIEASYLIMQFADGNYMRPENAIYNGVGQDWAMNGTVEVETTAVPEPGSLILTGSALLAGAIGVYFTRRHRDQALTPAAV
jgi:hypothetical protein